MSVVRKITVKAELEHYFKTNEILLHLYEIGDLDDFFWNQTSWYALIQEPDDTEFIALVYSGASPPVVIALGHNVGSGIELLQRMHTTHILPARFYSHLSLGLSEAFTMQCDSEHYGKYFKMGLKNSILAKAAAIPGTELLLASDLPQIETFYRVHYPDNWFDARMLETMQTFGVWSSGMSGTSGENKRELLAIAGVHVFSVEYSVAALGNIATHNEHRGQGLARRVTAALVQSLLQNGIQHIGLNVQADNHAAVACYTKLGFVHVADFEEIMWSAK